MNLRARRAREAAVRSSGAERRRDAYARGGGGAVTREGALVMVDDDQGMRGRALAGGATDDGW